MELDLKKRKVEGESNEIDILSTNANQQTIKSEAQGNYMTDTNAAKQSGSQILFPAQSEREMLQSHFSKLDFLFSKSLEDELRTNNSDQNTVGGIRTCLLEDLGFLVLRYLESLNAPHVSLPFQKYLYQIIFEKGNNNQNKNTNNADAATQSPLDQKLNLKGNLQPQEGPQEELSLDDFLNPNLTPQSVFLRKNATFLKAIFELSEAVRLEQEASSTKAQRNVAWQQFYQRPLNFADTDTPDHHIENHQTKEQINKAMEEYISHRQQVSDSLNKEQFANAKLQKGQTPSARTNPTINKHGRIFVDTQYQHQTWPAPAQQTLPSQSAPPPSSSVAMRLKPIEIHLGMPPDMRPKTADPKSQKRSSSEDVPDPQQLHARMGLAEQRLLQVEKQVRDAQKNIPELISSGPYGSPSKGAAPQAMSTPMKPEIVSPPVPQAEPQLQGFQGHAVSSSSAYQGHIVSNSSPQAPPFSPPQTSLPIKSEKTKTDILPSASAPSSSSSSVGSSGSGSEDLDEKIRKLKEALRQKVVAKQQK